MQPHLFDKLVKLITLASVFSCALLLLTLGPSFQQHGLALLTSSSSGVYQSVYKDALISFPTFRNWVSGQDYYSYSIGAAFLVASLRLSRSMRGALILTSVVSFLFMTLLDLWINIAGPIFDGGALLASAASNIIGAPLTSSILLVIVWCAERLKNSASEHIKVSKVVAALLPAILGLLVFLFQYYTLALLFNPTPTNVEAKQSPKSSATYLFNEEMKIRLKKKAEECACEPAQTPTQKSKDANFGYLKGKFEGEYQFQGIPKNGKIKWNATTDEKFDIYVTAFDGCYDDDSLKKAETRTSNSLKVNNATILVISPDKGMLTIAAKSDTGNLDFQDSDVVPTWFTKEGNDYRLNRFTQASNDVDYWTNDESNKLFLRLPLLASKDNTSVTDAARVVKLTINEKTYSLAFNPKKNKSNSTKCSPLKISDSSVALNEYKAKSGIVSLIVEVKRSEETSTYSTAKRNNFTFSGLEGWTQIVGIAPERIRDLVSTGSMQGLTIGGQVDYLRLNGVSVPDLTGHVFAFYSGHIDGSSDYEGSLVYEGSADWVWIDGKRWSKTRWESLDGATQGIMLTLAGLAILAFGRLFQLCMRDNNVYSL